MENAFIRFSHCRYQCSVLKRNLEVLLLYLSISVFWRLSASRCTTFDTDGIKGCFVDSHHKIFNDHYFFPSFLPFIHFLVPPFFIISFFHSALPSVPLPFLFPTLFISFLVFFCLFSFRFFLPVLLDLFFSTAFLPSLSLHHFLLPFPFSFVTCCLSYVLSSFLSLYFQ